MTSVFMTFFKFKMQFLRKKYFSYYTFKAVWSQKKKKKPNLKNKSTSWNLKCSKSLCLLITCFHPFVLNIWKLYYNQLWKMPQNTDNCTQQFLHFSHDETNITYTNITFTLLHQATCSYKNSNRASNLSTLHSADAASIMGMNSIANFSYYIHFSLPTHALIN